VPLNIAFAETLQRALVRHGCAELAQRSGLEVDEVEAMACGQVPTAETLARLCDLLASSADERAELYRSAGYPTT
jgi:hypothetical protein